MAPKHSTPVQDPSASSSSSSSDEEEETASSGEEESSSEVNEPQKNKSSSPPLPHIPKLVKKPDSAKSKSESESGDESDSESEEVAPSDVKSPKSRDVAGKSTSKRASEADRDAKESKRSKTKDAADDSKKQLFQRLWSDEDEVALLNGILLFIEKKGTDPAKDMTAFFDFVKKSLHLNVSLSQVKDKVMRLKRKFGNQIKRGTKGESKIFSKAHDQEVFRLSRKIWGKEGLLGKRKSLLPSVEKQVGSREIRKLDNGAGTTVKQFGSKGISNIDRGVRSGSMEEYVINKGLDMLDGAKRSEMEQKWMETHVDELKLFVKRSELIIEQAKLMLEN